MDHRGHAGDHPLTDDHPSVPPGFRVYAFGDVHGRPDLLDRLFALILEDSRTASPATSIEVVGLGDYVDRGPDSRGVLERLLAPALPGLKTVFLRGNHDECLRLFLDGNLDLAPGWFAYGGLATLASYGVNPFRAGGQKRLEELREALAQKVPAAHKELLDSLPFAHMRGDYHFVHAGIRPHVPLDQQASNDLMWIRHGFLDSPAAHGKIIVHGHSITDAPDVRPNRIGVDTGAYATGRLTCVALEGSSVRFLST